MNNSTLKQSLRFKECLKLLDLGNWWISGFNGVPVAATWKSQRRRGRKGLTWWARPPSRSSLTVASAASRPATRWWPETWSRTPVASAAVWALSTSHFPSVNPLSTCSSKTFFAGNFAKVPITLSWFCICIEVMLLIWLLLFSPVRLRHYI